MRERRCTGVRGSTWLGGRSVAVGGPRQRRRAALALAAAAAAAALCSPPAARAVDGTWSNVAGGNWSLTTNWTGGVVADGASSTANFSTINLVTATRTVTIDTTPRTVGTLLIGDNSTTDNRPYVIAATGGGTLAFDNGANAAVLQQINNSAGDTISAPVALNSSLNINSLDTTHNLTIATGGITAGTAGTKTITIGGTAAGGIAITAPVGDGGAGGVVAIVKNNAANALGLSGTNTYTGGLTLNAGTVNLNSTTALGAAAGVFTVAGGTVANSSAGSITIANANNQTWSGDFAFGGIRDLNLGAGTVTLTAARTVTVSGSGTYTVGNVGDGGGAFKLSTANGSTGVATGTLVLGGTNAYTGGTDVNGGVVRFEAGAVPATGSVTIGVGGAVAVAGVHTTLAGWLGNPALSAASTGALALTADSAEAYTPATFATLSLGAEAGAAVTYAGTYTPAASTYFAGGGGGSITFANANAFTGAGRNLTVGNGGGGTVILSADNDYAGATTVVAGATLQVGAGATAGSINGTSGVANAGTVVFNRSDAAGFAPVVSGAGSVVKTGTGTLTLGAAQAYTGPTIIDRGTLGTSVAQTLTGPLLFGRTTSTTTTGALDLTGGNATFGSFNVQTNSATANVLTIPAGRTLTINGDFKVGTDLAASTTTALTATGGGTLTVANAATNGVFVVGGTTNAANQGNRATADFSGLGALNVTLNATTGVFRVNPTSGSNVANKISTVTLPGTGAGNATIVASAINVGDGSQNASGQVNELLLGTGVNTLRADAVNVGTGGRDVGAIRFNAAGGSLVVRNAAGTGAAALNIGTGSAATGVGGNNAFDTRGHDADLQFAAVAIGTQPRSIDHGNDLWFDQGTMTMASLTMATKGTGGSSTNGGTNRTTTANLNVGGGTVNITGGVLRLGNVTSTTGNQGTSLSGAVGNINVSGGTVTIGATGGTSVTMAGAIADTIAGGTVNLTGGTTTLAGNIVKTGGAGTTTATLTLDGGTLDMGGKLIGTAGSPLNAVNLRSGTLRNVAEVNGGAQLVKSTAGTLVLAGTNAYAGGTAVNAGTLLANSAAATSAGPVTVAGGATVGGVGSIAGMISVAAGGALMGGDGTAPAGALTTDGAVTLADLSQVKLVLGSGFAHSSLNRGAPGSILFDADQQFAIVDVGAQVGTYQDVITNLSADPGGTNTWTIVTPGIAGTFVYDGAGNVDLTLTAVPEPASAGLLALAAVGLLARRRRGHA